MEAVTAEIRERIKARAMKLELVHEKWVERLERDEAAPAATTVAGGSGSYVTVPHIMRALREVTAPYSAKSLIINEAISNYGLVWEHARPELPGSFLTSGGSSLGYALGASVGAILGDRVQAGNGNSPRYDLVTTVVGDGTFMFAVPSSAFWIARRYETPFLTIVLNNGGWKSPKLSMLGVHPHGHGSNALSGEQLSVGFSFDPTSTSPAQSDRISPNYAQIAVAATDGWAWGKKVSVTVRAKSELLSDSVGNGSQPELGDVNRILESIKDTLAEAVRVVVEEKRCAVVDCLLEAL
jgi:hypothetical protein